MTRKWQTMTYNDTSNIWSPSLAENHVYVGAFDWNGNDHWIWIDNTPFNYSNWVNNTAIYSPSAAETCAAILPDFAPAPGVWNNIGVSTQVRAGVCTYDLCLC